MRKIVSIFKNGYKNKYILIVAWFVIPAVVGLGFLRLLYSLHHINLIELDFQIRHHMQAINRSYPILFYAVGVACSSLLLGKLFLKVKNYFFGSVLGCLVYFLAITFYVSLVAIFNLFLGEVDFFELPATILFLHIVSFIGFCFQDCAHGYAWPSLFFGLVWGALFVLLKNKSYFKKVL